MGICIQKICIIINFVFCFYDEKKFKRNENIVNGYGYLGI